MGYNDNSSNCSLKSPKKEEQRVPDSINQFEFADIKTTISDDNNIMDSLEGIWSHLDHDEDQSRHLCNWDLNLMDWEDEEEEEDYEDKSVVVVDDEKSKCLNLNLNYQDVLDAWSDRGPLLAHDCSLSMQHTNYMGEVPVMEEERSRREASVIRYKEKRQTRLFSKKIRYQVRKLNADKRPRLKGRFVKRVS